VGLLRNARPALVDYKNDVFHARQLHFVNNILNAPIFCARIGSDKYDAL